MINPIIQYTAFEQLKNFLVARRTGNLRVAGAGAASVVASLSDWDFFLLGAFSKLSGLLLSENEPILMFTRHCQLPRPPHIPTCMPFESDLHQLFLIS